MSEQPEPETAASRWWRYAKEDLEIAQRLTADGTSHRWVAVLAQQAAEKAVKALLIEKDIDFPRTHDVSRLVRLLPEGLLPQQDRRRPHPDHRSGHRRWSRGIPIHATAHERPVP